MTHHSTLDTRELYLSAGTLTELGVEVDAAIENIELPWKFTGVSVDCEVTHLGAFQNPNLATAIRWTATVGSEARQSEYRRD
jgi:hypothetical protein